VSTFPQRANADELVCSNDVVAASLLNTLGQCYCERRTCNGVTKAVIEAEIEPWQPKNANRTPINELRNNMESHLDDLVHRLKRLDCCAVSDALDKLGLHGVVSGLDQRASLRRIAGRVVTYRLVPKDEAPPPPPGPPRHLGTTAIELATPGDIIVVEQRTGINAGSWGGILTLGAKMRGIAGVIADGPVRDIDEARAYDFPIYARALTAQTARGRVAEAETNQPVKIGDVNVYPGDYAIADASGVAFIPAADIIRVVEAAEQIAGREAAMARALLGGTSISTVMGADYEYMLR
jgi:regulator of RNase E activity RraA